MIPQNISRGDVIKAIKRIQAEGIPNKRQSSKFDLLYQCFRFPPKLILSIANEYANGEPLDHDLFSSGDEANTYLSSLGFEIVLKEPEKVQLVDPEEEEFPEGKVLYRRHCTYEPDRRLVTKAKQRRKRETGSLDCEVCGFNFFETYGAIGEDYIECHHTKPVSELGDNEKTSIKELALVCANCHRMLHRKRPWLSMKQLRDLRTNSES